MVSPELLRRYKCFAGIDEESLVAVAMISSPACVRAGTEIFHEADPADKLRLIVDGEVTIQYTLGTGQQRTVDTLVQGDLLGWSALVEPYKMTSLATATAETRLIEIEAKKLRELCDRDPWLGYRLMTQVTKLLSDRLEGARVQLAAV